MAGVRVVVLLACALVAVGVHASTTMDASSQPHAAPADADADAAFAATLRTNADHLATRGRPGRPGGFGVGYGTYRRPQVDNYVASTPEEAAVVAEARARGLYHFGIPGNFFDPALFPRFVSLLEHWEAIRDEALAILPNMNLKRTHPSFEHPSTQKFMQDMFDAGNTGWSHAWAKDGGWRNYALVMHDEVIPGVTEQLCPLTVRLMKTMPGIRLGGFSRLAPNARIEPHVDHTGLGNGSLSFHLYLSGYARMRVVDEWVEHIPGTLQVFDSNVNHEVENGDEDRIILYIDVDVSMFFVGSEGFDLTESAKAYYRRLDE